MSRLNGLEGALAADWDAIGRARVVVVGVRYSWSWKVDGYIMVPLALRRVIIAYIPTRKGNIKSQSCCSGMGNEIGLTGWDGICCGDLWVRFGVSDRQMHDAGELCNRMTNPKTSKGHRRDIESHRRAIEEPSKRVKVQKIEFLTVNI